MIKRTKPYLVGVRLPEWTNGYIYRLFEGLVHFQRHEAPFRLVFNQPSDGDLPSSVIDENWLGDGLIVFRYSKAEGEAWAKRGIAVVNLSTEIATDAPVFPRVTMDNQQAGVMAAQHLLALGLRNFCFIHESNRAYSWERLEGYERVIRAAGGNLTVVTIPASSFAVEDRYKQVELLLHPALSKLPRPCGIFTKDDIAGVWVMQMLELLGIRCPDEMPVISVNNDIVFCHTTQPPLTSIVYPAKRIGIEAARTLHAMLESENSPEVKRQRIVPHQIITRESTGRVLLNDPALNQALDFIRKNIKHRNVYVEEIAAHCAISRELLRQKFRLHLQISPKEEIERLRLHHLTDLLLQSSLTLEAVAERCGFSGSDEVCRFIKRHTGQTPGRLRKQVI